jgi:hypothetical protein
MPDSNALSQIAGHDPDELAARQAMLSANTAYLNAQASGATADAQLLALNKATASWQDAFLKAASAHDPYFDRKIADADAAYQAQKQAVNEMPHMTAGMPRTDDPNEGVEQAAKLFFPGYESVSEREQADENKAKEHQNSVYAAQQFGASYKLDTLRKDRDRAFADFRRKFGIATAIDDGAKHDGSGSAKADTGHYDDGHSFGWKVNEPSNTKALIAGAALAVIAGVAAAVYLLGGGGGNKSTSHTSTDQNGSGQPAVAAARTVGIASGTPNDAASAIIASGTPDLASPRSGPILSGGYLETVQVKKDVPGSAKFINMPGQIKLDILIQRDVTTGKITISMTGPFPWISLDGTAQFGQSFTVSGGDFEASGEGTVAGYPNVKVDFTGSVIARTGLQGDLSMGTNGALPTGQPTTYSLNGTKP